jgi:hypothetical protein
LLNGFRKFRFLPGLDLNFEPVICHPARNLFAGVIDAHGQAGFCTVDGTSAADNLSSLRGALRWTSQNQAFHLFGSIPVDGVCTTDLSREPARYRSLSAGAVLQALSLGLSQHGSAQHPGQRHATRDWRIYCDFAQRLIAIARRLYANEPLGVDLKDTVYALDATTIDLCLSVFPWAPFRSTKAAIKLHTLLDLRGNIPSFIHISDGKYHEINLLDELIVEPGAFYVMDRGYIDFERLFRLSEAGSFFVTRAKSNLKVQRRYSRKVDKSTGLICDQTVVLTVFYSRKGFDAPLRRIRFKDPQSGKTLVFLTNNFVLPALTITQLYRLRWRIELFFKWIKQHLRIKAFFGITENAVKTQIWIAISVYVLVAIIKKRLNLSASLYELLQILSLTLFERISLIQLVADSNSATDLLKVHKQLNLFN